MVASPESNRLNAQRSTGPRTARGKAIASINATKHGLLSHQPPLVVGEDLTTFQGVVQALIDEYDPKGATEQLLVQQLAMAHLRLHRLWGAEAAIARLEQLRLERNAKRPQLRHSPHDEGKFVLQSERKKLNQLLMGIEDIQYWIPKRITRKWSEGKDASDHLGDLKELLDTTVKKFPYEAIPPDELLKARLADGSTWVKLLRWQAYAEMEVSDYGRHLVWVLDQLLPDVNARVAEIDAHLADLDRIDQEQHQAAIAIQAIPQDADKLARYEARIMRTMETVLDRLTALQERRGAGFMGSFGKK